MAFGCGLAAVAAALYLARFVRHNRVLGLVPAGIVVGGVSEAVLSEGCLQEAVCAPMMGPELEARLHRSYDAALHYTKGELFDWIEERG